MNAQLKNELHHLRATLNQLKDKPEPTTELEAFEIKVLAERTAYWSRMVELSFASAKQCAEGVLA